MNMHEELNALVSFRIKSSAIKLTPNHLHDSTMLTLGCFLGFGMAIKLWIFCFIQLTLLLGELGLNIQEAHAVMAIPWTYLHCLSFFFLNKVINTFGWHEGVNKTDFVAEPCILLLCWEQLWLFSCACS
jgi:hypothetical protein